MKRAPSNAVNGSPVLTLAQAEVCRLICAGCCDKEIAAKVGVTRAAVRKRIEGLFRKLDCQSRVGLALAFVSARERATEDSIHKTTMRAGSRRGKVPT